jgi:hypothetical protein
MIVYSGTEGGATMTSNLQMVSAYVGTTDFVFAVLDGVQYNGNGQAGATVLDDVRAKYDVDTSGTPSKDAAQLCFAPYGNAGPGGDYADANAIVNGMKGADYRTPPPAPYDGPGSGTHGATEQFLAALEWFPGKTRQ